MRGSDSRSGSLFSYVDCQRRSKHPQIAQRFPGLGLKRHVIAFANGDAPKPVPLGLVPPAIAGGQTLRRAASIGAKTSKVGRADLTIMAQLPRRPLRP